MAETNPPPGRLFGRGFGEGGGLRLRPAGAGTRGGSGDVAGRAGGTRGGGEAVSIPVAMAIFIPGEGGCQGGAAGRVGGLEREVVDAGAGFAAEALDKAELLRTGEAGGHDAVEGFAVGLEVAADPGAVAGGIREEEALGGIRDVHGAACGPAGPRKRFPLGHYRLAIRDDKIC